MQTIRVCSRTALIWICKPAYLVPVPSQDEVGGLRQEGHSAYKMGDEGGGSLISLDGVAPIWMVSVSTSVILPCTTKIQKIFFLAPADPANPRKRAVKRWWWCFNLAHLLLDYNKALVLVLRACLKPISSHCAHDRHRDVEGCNVHLTRRRSSQREIFHVNQ